jgi:hypothetical protein
MMTDEEEKASKSFVPFYECGAQIYMSLKLSKDGLSREEDADVLKGMYDLGAKDKNIGAKLRSHLIDAQQREYND